MYMIEILDNSILQFIQINMRSPIRDRIMILLTSMGSYGVIWIIIGLAFFISKKYRKDASMIIVALMLCYVIGNLGLKFLVARTRPFDVMPLLGGLLIKTPKDFSFPSGHTMSSFAASIVILYMNKRIGVFALILSTFIGFSRLYLYVHYPSDVFGGMIIGILIGILTITIFKKMEKRNRKHFKIKEF